MPEARIPAGLFLAGEDEKRLAVALCLSLLFHAWVLLGWRQVLPRLRAGGETSLTVTFRQAAVTEHVEAASLQAGSGGKHATVIEAPNSRAHIARQAGGVEKRPVAAVQPRPQPSEPSRESPRRQENVAAGVQERTGKRMPGEVSVLLIIDEGGRPGQIVWDQLPALTHEQFRLLEERIRGRVYPGALSGARLGEIIDVFAILRAPQRPSAEAGQAAPVGN